MGQAMRVVDVVITEATFDAQTVVIGRPVASIDGYNFIVERVISRLAADTAVGAKAIDRIGGLDDFQAGGIDQRFWHQCPCRAGLNAFAAAHAGGNAHGRLDIEDDSSIVAAMGDADHVVDLHFATGPLAQAAMDTGV